MGVELVKQSGKREEWKFCGDLLRRELLENRGFLILDGDGVIFQSDSLYKPQLTTSNIVSALRAFETEGGIIGLATARSDSVVSYLRKEGIRLDGPLILEGGHVVIIEGIKTVFATEEYRMFVRNLRKMIVEAPFYRKSWEDVLIFTRDHKDAIAVCLGNKQWNGDYRATFWYSWKEERSLGAADEIVKQLVIPQITNIALGNGLTSDHFNVKLARMDNGLGILRIAYKQNGIVVSKEAAAQTIWNGLHVVYVADGEGDLGFESTTQKHKGKVIALGGSHDLTPDVPVFLHQADMRLANPGEFVRALQYATDLWKQ